jgi:hypothetical protein
MVLPEEQSFRPIPHVFRWSPHSPDLLGRGDNREGPQHDTNPVQEPSIVAVGRTDWDSPPVDVLQLLNSATSTKEDQDVGISGVHLPRPSFP